MPVLVIDAFYVILFIKHLHNHNFLHSLMKHIAAHATVLQTQLTTVWELATQTCLDKASAEGSITYSPGISSASLMAACHNSVIACLVQEAAHLVDLRPVYLQEAQGGGGIVSR